MKLLISVSADNDLSFPKVGPYGINGTYSTMFMSSPELAQGFVDYLEEIGIKKIYTGRYGNEYLVGWEGKYIDVAAWKSKWFAR
jgi:hypothetical protein